MVAIYNGHWYTIKTPSGPRIKVYCEARDQVHTLRYRRIEEHTHKISTEAGKHVNGGGGGRHIVRARREGDTAAGCIFVQVSGLKAVCGSAFIVPRSLVHGETAGICRR